MTDNQVNEVFAEVSAFVRETYDSVDIHVFDAANNPYQIAVRSNAVSPETDGARAVEMICNEVFGLLHAVTGETPEIVDFGGMWDSRSVENSIVAIEIEEMPRRKKNASVTDMFVSIKVTEPNWSTGRTVSEATNKLEIFSHVKEMWDEFVAQFIETYGQENVKASSLMYQKERLTFTTDTIQSPELANTIKGLLYVTTGEKPKIIAPSGYKKFPWRGATWKVRAGRVEVSFYGIIDANMKPAYTVTMFPYFPGIDRATR